MRLGFQLIVDLSALVVVPLDAALTCVRGLPIDDEVIAVEVVAIHALDVDQQVHPVIGLDVGNNVVFTGNQEVQIVLILRNADFGNVVLHGIIHQHFLAAEVLIIAVDCPCHIIVHVTDVCPLAHALGDVDDRFGG